MNNSTTNSVNYFVSREQYEHSKFVIYLICIPIISLCGIIGNSFSLYILQKYPTKHAFAIYLKTLTATDTCLLVMSLLQSLLKICVWMNMKNAQKIEMYGIFYAGIIFGSLLQRLSSAFIAVIAIERLVAVMFPFKLRTMCIETRPVRILAGIVFFFALLQIPTLFVVHVGQAWVGNDTIYMISRTTEATQQNVLTKVYLFLIAGFGIGLPLCFVLVSACCIVFKMKKNENKTIVRSKVCKGSLEIESMTKTLIALATIFTAMSLPALLIYIWIGFDRSIETTYLRTLFVDVSVALICINSGSDFIIYCMTSKKFRVLFFESAICSYKEEEPPTTESVDQLPVVDIISTESVEISSETNWSRIHH